MEEQFAMEWVKFGKTNSLEAIGKDTVMLGFGSYIIFIDTTDKKEIYYHANNEARGDGVRCHCGHKSLLCFALAEQCGSPRILINTYPSMNNIKTISGSAETTYNSIMFSEMEYLIALTGPPHHLIVIWNWRTTEKMFSQSVAPAPNLNIRVSQTAPVVVTLSSKDKRNVQFWTMSLCYKKTVLEKEECLLPENSTPPYDFAWGGDGEMYAVDLAGCLFMLSQDNNEWKLEIGAPEGLKKPGDGWTPQVAWCKGGVVFTRGFEVLFCRRKSPEGWNTIFSTTTGDEIKIFVSSSQSTNITYWTSKQELVTLKGEKNIERVVIKHYGVDFQMIGFINPLGDHFVAYGRATEMFSIWKTSNGELVSSLRLSKGSKVLAMSTSPLAPFLVACHSDGYLTCVNMFDPTYPMEFCDIHLTRNKINAIEFHKDGWQFCVVTKDIGEFFLVKLTEESKMDVIGHTKINSKIADFKLIEEEDDLKLIVLTIGQPCCSSGQVLYTYRLDQLENVFQYVAEHTLPEICVQISPALTKERIICVPHRSRKLYEIDEDRQETKKLTSGHQFKSFSIKTTFRSFLTFGFDGILTIRRQDYTCKTVYATHHRRNKGIRDVTLNIFEDCILSLGEDGTLVCLYAKKKNNENKKRYEEFENVLKSQTYKTVFQVPILAMKTRERALPFGKSHRDEDKEERKKLEDDVSKTWLELEEEKRVKQEEIMAKPERNKVLELFYVLRDQVKTLLDKNFENGPEEQLPICAFDLDSATRRQKLDEAKAEREKETHLDLAEISARDKVSDFIKNMCWEVMEPKKRGLWAIANSLCVYSYPLTPEKEQHKQQFKVIEEQMKDQRMRQEESVTDKEVHLGQQCLLSGGEDLQRLWSGTATHRYIEVHPYHCSQLQVKTLAQTENETQLCEHDIRHLKIWFNKEFAAMFAAKEKEMKNVIERNNRLRHIIEELSFFNFAPEICKTVVVDPQWEEVEHPENIVIVQDHEILTPKYISSSEQKRLHDATEEEERRRQELLSDNFRESALDMMMDGVLEKLWEDEIKKDIPRPLSMSKERELWTTEDFKAHAAYEESVRQLTNERERYRKIMEVEFEKLQIVQKNKISDFNDKVAQFHVLKLKVESAVCQEQLKILRMRYRNYQMVLMDRKEDAIRSQMSQKEKDIESLHADVDKLQAILNELKNHYEVVQNRDRNLDKNFKKDFPEYSPVICEQLYKLSKKRPKPLQKSAMFATVLVDLGKCAVNNSKPDHLPAECIDFLKGIDALDSTVNAPAVVSEQSWELTCKLRRTKIDSELKVRACANDLAEAETTVATFTKNLRNAKENMAQLQHQLQVVGEEKEQERQNYQVQLVMQQGYVEVRCTGHMSDFNNVILVGRNTLDNINSIIKRAGTKKLKAMEKAANFRKGIITKEWEHKKLKMEIEDLERGLQTIEQIKVTKELQTILTSRARGFTEEKGFLYLEKEMERTKQRFEMMEADVLSEINEVNGKIDKLNAQNDQLDEKISELNIEVKEKNLLRDKEFEQRQQHNSKQRMHMVVHRSKLVQKIQDQHSEILMLQTELELLRLKTFPTIKFKTV